MMNIETGKATRVVIPAAFKPLVINKAATIPPVNGGTAATTVFQLKNSEPMDKVKAKVPTTPSKAMQTAFHCLNNSFKFISVPIWTSNNDMATPTNWVVYEACGTTFLGRIVQ